MRDFMIRTDGIVMELCCGPTDRATWATSITIRCKAKASTSRL